MQRIEINDSFQSQRRTWFIHSKWPAKVSKKHTREVRTILILTWKPLTSFSCSIRALAVPKCFTLWLTPGWTIDSSQNATWCGLENWEIWCISKHWSWTGICILLEEKTGRLGNTGITRGAMTPEMQNGPRGRGWMSLDVVTQLMFLMAASTSLVRFYFVLVDFFWVGGALGFFSGGGGLRGNSNIVKIIMIKSISMTSYLFLRWMFDGPFCEENKVIKIKINFNIDDYWLNQIGSL